MDTEKTSVKFYQSLGKLFYAIAAADKKVNEKEVFTLKKVVRSYWQGIELSEDGYTSDAAYQVEVVFDWLYQKEMYDAQTWFNDFLAYKNEHEGQFTDHIKDQILKTAHAIAASFAGKNKSELILLGKLNLNFKKTNHKSTFE